MSQEAGWYDDPQDPGALRYWDGVEWTNHTSPKQRPNPGQTEATQQAARGQAPAGPGQPSGTLGGYGQQGYGAQQQGGEPANPYAAHQQAQWAMTGGGYQPQRDPRDLTPDGQEIAGWWHRVGARLADLIVLIPLYVVVMMVVTPNFWGDYLDWAMTVDPTTVSVASVPENLVTQQVTWILSSAVATLAYEVVMVSLFGGTVGKLITGLRIRLRDEPGNIGWTPALLRGLVYQGPGVLGNLHTLLSILPLFTLINVLWPLWDPKKQALHDKVAKTNVVRHRR